jgi:formylglycine-generating enzyme
MRSLLILALASCAVSRVHAGSGEIKVPGGIYKPFFREKGEKDQAVAPLLVDRYPVTNAEYLLFVTGRPDWRRSAVKRVFADSGYLGHWAGDLEFRKGEGNHPVTNVSWFAARRYCASLGKRLMTTAEWEFAADAQNPSNLSQILEWYGRTGEAGRPVTAGRANAFGLIGMHGLIWEWVDDFAAAIMAGDSRSSNETGKSLFCGGGSLAAKDPSQYATFMRFAYRSSISAGSVGRALGFRCVREENL